MLEAGCPVIADKAVILRCSASTEVYLDSVIVNSSALISTRCLRSLTRRPNLVLRFWLR